MRAISDMTEGEVQSLMSICDTRAWKSWLNYPIRKFVGGLDDMSQAIQTEVLAAWSKRGVPPAESFSRSTFHYARLCVKGIFKHLLYPTRDAAANGLQRRGMEFAEEVSLEDEAFDMIDAYARAKQVFRRVGFTANEQQAFALHHGSGLNFEEVGARMGITRVRVRQLHIAAMKKIDQTIRLTGGLEP